MHSDDTINVVEGKYTNHVEHHGNGTSPQRLGVKCTSLLGQFRQ